MGPLIGPLIGPLGAGELLIYSLNMRQVKPLCI